LLAGESLEQASFENERTEDVWSLSKLGMNDSIEKLVSGKAGRSMGKGSQGINKDRRRKPGPPNPRRSDQGSSSKKQLLNFCRQNNV
jgi:hypothetical protein